MDKQTLRERVWDTLEERGEARFPFPPHGRIPNVAGADRAASRLAETPEWERATAVKSNPDSPQRSVRKRALDAGKTVYMAVPRLRDEQCFLRLDPAVIDDVDHATTIGGSAELGVPVGPDDVGPIDLVVSGSVAVSPSGERVGKGEGYGDLEYALLREFGLVDESTVVVTTVHECQVVSESIPTRAHDVPMDVIVTPEREIRPDAGPKPDGIDWDQLPADRITEIPVLDRLAP